MSVHVREAAWPDLEPMAALEARVFPDDAWPVATFWAELAQRPRRRYWVALEPAAGGKSPELVGYAGVALSQDVADVMTLAVDPRRRGSGLGTRLLDQLHAAGLDQGAAAMMLEVRADNAAAGQLYARHGYVTIHTRADYYRTREGLCVDALIMRKELR